MPSKMFFTYSEDEKGNLTITKVYSLIDGNLVEEDFDYDKHSVVFAEFCSANGIEGNDVIVEAEKRGIFGRFNENELTEETLAEFLGAEISKPVVEEVTPEKEETKVEPEEITKEEVTEEDKEITEDEEIKEDNKALKRVVYGALAAATAAGILAGVHSCSRQQIDEAKNEEDLDDLYKNMTEEQKAFFKPTFETVEAFNNKATKDGNFKLDEDKTELHITVEEAVALNIMMNDYSADELYNIFGTLNFDTTDIMNLARSAYSKLSTYYMNAKEASGLSALINDEDARSFFERHENAVIAFNNNPTTELSDEVIKGLYYDYVHGGSTGEYVKINNDSVAWLATSAGFGFELANRNVEEFLRINNVSEEEIAKYGEAAAAVGMSLNEITTSDLLKGINEEIDLDVMDEIDNKSLCASATEKTREKVEALKMKQQITTTIISTNAKDSLVEGLRNIGANSLANKVSANELNLSSELLDEISNYSMDANRLVEEYNGKLDALTNSEAKTIALLEIAQEKFGKSTDIDLADLVNNRFRGLEKELESNKGEAINRDEFNSMSKQEQDEFIKENGIVVGTTTEKTETKVEENELTPTEKEEVLDQKAVLQEIELFKNELITKGVNDAVTYTDEVGAYKYSKEIVITFNNQKIDTNNMSLFNIVAYASAFGDGAKEINSNDSQVQARMNKDSERVVSEIDELSKEAKEYLQKEYGSNWKEQFIANSYKYGFSEQINGSLARAREYGIQIKQEAKELYDKAQASVNSKNEEEVIRPVLPPVDKPSIDTSDPNLNPDHKEEDEQPYVIREIEEPLHYVSDQDWEKAYGSTQDSAVKTK